MIRLSASERAWKAGERMTSRLLILLLLPAYLVGGVLAGIWLAAILFAQHWRDWR